MFYIGIDLGTSAVKLLLMDRDGKIVNIVSREYPLYFPRPGWSEQKPEDWYQQTLSFEKDNPGQAYRRLKGGRHPYPGRLRAERRQSTPAGRDGTV